MARYNRRRGKRRSRRARTGPGTGRQRIGFRL